MFVNGSIFVYVCEGEEWSIATVCSPMDDFISEDSRDLLE